MEIRVNLFFIFGVFVVLFTIGWLIYRNYDTFCEEGSNESVKPSNFEKYVHSAAPSKDFHKVEDTFQFEESIQIKIALLYGIGLIKCLHCDYNVSPHENSL